jgi:putative endonuclease
MDSKEMGVEGEAYAVQWLLWHDYVVEQKNWRTGRLEIDIIARTGRTLVFVEVKTRGSDWFSDPETAVDLAKQKAMMKAAAAYVEQTQHQGSVRFDVVAVVLAPHVKKLLHIPDAFFPLSSD